METFRYIIAVMLIMAIPAGIGFWLLIHPFIALWRKTGPRIAYTVVCAVVLAIMAGMFSLRGWLLETDYGLNWPLAAVGFVLLVASGVLLKKVRKHLTIKALIGMPELDPDRQPSRLLTEGLYGIVRHPRYLQMDLAILGYALIANYPVVYLMFAVWLAGIYLVTLLEERELRERFGIEYIEYCRRVPRFVPKPTSMMRKISNE